MASRIFITEDLKFCTSPEDYAEEINKSLAKIEDSWFKHCCSHINTSMKIRKECSQRLSILSSLHAIFTQFRKDEYSLSYVDGNKISSSTNHIHTIVSGANHEENSIKSIQNVRHKIPVHDKMDHFNGDVSKWYNRTASIFLKNAKFIEIMLLLFQSNCVFTSYLAKKVIITVVAYNSDTINIILQTIKSLLLQDLKENIRVFDLLQQFMSIQHFKETFPHPVHEKTYNWFIDLFEGKLMLSLSGIMMKSMQKKEEWIKLVNCLSFIKKIVKYGNAHGKKIQPSFVSILMDVFINHTCNSNSSDDNAKPYHSVIFKLIKIINVSLDLNIILEQGVITKSVLEIVVQMLRHFPSVFTGLIENASCQNISFWGSGHLVAVKTEKRQCHFSFSFSMARQLMILSIKSCLFSCFSNSFEDMNIKHFTYQTYDMFKNWFIQKQSSVMIESEWLPAFLGEDDDQWITVLLCLLLILSNLKNKEKSQACSSSSLQDQSEGHNNCDNKERLQNERRNKMTIDNQIIKSSSLSSADSGTNLSVSPDSDTNLSVSSLAIYHHPLCPHKLFLQFVNFIAYDHLVIADLLMSPETYFLTYFTKYIALLNDEWNIFNQYFSHFEVKETVPVVMSVRAMANQNIDTKHTVGQLDIALTNSYNSNSNSGECELQSDDRLSKYFPQSHKHDIRHCVLQRNDDSIIEPLDKKTRLNSSVSETTSNQFLTNSKSNQILQKVTSSLVSYSDSDDSDSLSSNSGVDLCGKSMSCQSSEVDLCGKSMSCQSSEVDLCGKSMSCQSSESFKNLEVSNKEEIESSRTVYERNTISVNKRQCMQCIDGIIIPSVNEGNKPSVSSASDTESDSDESEQDSTEDEDFCETNNTLERFMTMLIRLQLHIGRLSDCSLIPYNVNRLLKLMSVCIDKYESPQMPL